MEGKRIKWGNVMILLLIIAAGVTAIYFKNSDAFNKALGWEQNTKEQTENSLNSEQTSGKEADEFVMGLDSWVGGTPALMALYRGYNRDYQLNLKLAYIHNDKDRIQALKRGEIQVTEMSLPSFIRLQQEYPDAGIIIGITDFSRGGDGIVAKAEVKDLNDMEDRTVSYVGDGTGKFILNKFLRLTGLRYQDIIPLERNEMGEVITDFKTGRADLIVSWSPDMNIAVKEMNQALPDSVKLLITTKEVPNLIPTVLVANKAAVEQHPERVKSFLKTWFASVKYIIERPDKAYSNLSALMNQRQEDYGTVSLADVQDSLSNIKLMSLNDDFDYLGFGKEEEKMSLIINDTVQTWKKYGDLGSISLEVDKILSLNFMKEMHGENDDELLIKEAANTEAKNTGTAEGPSGFSKQDEISIEKNTEKVAKVDIPPVFYDTGKATVKEESLPVLDEVISILHQFPQYYLVIDAHTDSVGAEEANLKLSRDRAQEVLKYLKQQNIDPNRMVARGWGEYRPVVSQETSEADRAKNRRTEFTLTRKTEQ